MISLHTLTSNELDELRHTLHYKAMQLEKRINRMERQLQRRRSQSLLLHAARTALTHLHSEAQRLEAFLHTHGAEPAMLTAQHQLVLKYNQLLNALPLHSREAPDRAELMQLELRLEAMLHKRQNYLNTLTEVEGMSGGVEER